MNCAATSTNDAQEGLRLATATAVLPLRGHAVMGRQSISSIRVTAGICPFTGFILHFQISPERESRSHGR